jgi:hypothetical protein
MVSLSKPLERTDTRDERSAAVGASVFPPRFGFSNCAFILVLNSGFPC